MAVKTSRAMKPDNTSSHRGLRSKLTEAQWQGDAAAGLLLRQDCPRLAGLRAGGGRRGAAGAHHHTDSWQGGSVSVSVSVSTVSVEIQLFYLSTLIAFK